MPHEHHDPDAEPAGARWEAHWHALMAVMPDAAWFKDTGGIYRACNPAFARRLQREPAEVIGHDDIELVGAQRAAWFRATDEMALRADGPVTAVDVEAAGPDGTAAYFEFTKTPVRDAQGQLLGILGMARDITVQRATERQLRDANQNLQATLAALPDLVMEVDGDGTYLMVLSPRHQLLVRPVGQLLGRRMDQVLPEPAASISMAALAQAREHGQGSGSPYALDLPGGRSWFEIAFRRKDNGDGQPPTYIGLARDVTRHRRAEESLRITLDSMAQGIAQFDAAGELILYNRRCQELMDFSDAFMATRPSLRQQIAHQLARADFVPVAAGPMADYIRSGDVRDIPPSYCRRHNDGRVLQVDTQVRPDGGIVRTFTDVTAYFTAQEQLQREQQRLEQILDGTQAGTWDWDIASGETRINTRWAEIIGEQLSDLVPLTRERFLARMHPEDRERSHQRWLAYTRGESDRYECDMRLRHRAGHWVWVLSRGRAYAWDADGRPSRVAGTELDISELKLAEDRLRHMAQHDPLTGLPNRVLMGDRLQRAIALARRERRQLCLMFVDLDRFKAINDSLGHDIGDSVLRQAAQRMVACMRETDSVARMGGDEFVVLIEGLERADDALAVAEKLRQSLDLPFEVDHHRLDVSASIGLALYPQHGRDDTALLVSADQAMYTAKNLGGNQVRLAQPS